MAKRHGRKSVERSRYREYERVADHFYAAAKDSMELVPLLISKFVVFIAEAQSTRRVRRAKASMFSAFLCDLRVSALKD